MDSSNLQDSSKLLLQDDKNVELSEISLTPMSSSAQANGYTEDLSIFPVLNSFSGFSSPCMVYNYAGQSQDAATVTLVPDGYYDLDMLDASQQNSVRSPTLLSASSVTVGEGARSPELSDVSMGTSYTPLRSPSEYGMSPVAVLGNLAASSGLVKHFCAICADRASGKHYGVYSCEGCKGFFKRTVRKELQYACRDNRNCAVDKHKRNRCQFCRYQKCLSAGMKREAVQEERQRVREKCESEVESSTAANDMPVEEILQAELAVDPHTENYVDAEEDPVTSICQAADKQLFSLVDWAKKIPHFMELPTDDQVTLLRAGWNELLIAGFSHRSTTVKDCLLLSTGMRIHRNSAYKAGVGVIFDRILTELVGKMRDMAVDKTELGCLRAIILFNPDAKDLKSVATVESLRDKVYLSLDEYCRLQYPDDTCRFAQLLLRLPALRSIGLKCIEHLFFIKLLGNTPLDSFLLEMLDSSSALP